MADTPIKDVSPLKGLSLQRITLPPQTIESGMDAFIDWKKDFVGRSATEVARDAGPVRRLVTMTIDVDGIDVSNDEAILKDGRAVGYVSSGGYAHHVQRSMAMGYVETALSDPGTELEIEILGQTYPARIVGAPLYDANGANMRA